MSLCSLRPLLKVAHYTLNQFLKSEENHLIMIESMMDTMYISQIGEKIANLDKNDHFQKFSSVNMNKSPRRILTHDLRFTSPILYPQSYGNIQPNRSIQTNEQNISIAILSKKV